MPPNKAVDVAPRRSGWLIISLKAAVAVAALTTMAQWASRSGVDSGKAASTAARDVYDPVVTGSVAPRARASLASPDLDQRGLSSLVSKTQLDQGRTTPPKKR